MRKLVTTFALGLSVLVAGCQPAEPEAEVVEEETKAAASPIVWVAQDNDSKLFLISAVSMMPKDMVWQSPAVSLAASQSKTLFLESDPGESAMMRSLMLTKEMGFYSDGTKLTESLDDRGMKNLDLATTRADMPEGALNNLKPWLAAASLGVAAGEGEKLSDENSMIDELYSKSEIKGHDIRFLSTPEERVRDLADLSASMQLKYLDRTLSDFSGLGDGMLKTANAWQKGDLGQLRTEYISIHTQLPSSQYNQFIKTRNERYLGKLVSFLEGQGTGMAVIQVPHLVDPGNLQVMLRERGYRVERYHGVD